jgi:ethanolamine utilization protein EutA
MADVLVAAVTADPLPPKVARLYLTEPLSELGRIDGVMFSGGVSEYAYGRERRGFGDLGRPLGRALRRRIDSGALPWPLLPAGECIRATALGASEYSVQLSGNTCWISDPDALLPRRNLQVVRPSYERLAAFAKGVREGFAERIERGRPVYVVLDGDVALTLGRLLREELDVVGELLVVDGLNLRDFDYVDIGRVRYPSNTVPVTIKSLVFSADPRQ